MKKPSLTTIFSSLPLAIFHEHRWLSFPLLSVFILTLGNGFYTTLNTVHMSTLTDIDWLVGLISSAYFIGIIAGSYFPQNTLLRFGFISTFLLHASINIFSTVLQSMTDTLVVWFIIRLMIGYCVGASFLLYESWFLSQGKASKRGFIYACYLCTYYLAQALGQLLLELKLSHFYLYSLIASCYLISAILFSASRRNSIKATGKQQRVNIIKLLKQSPLACYTSLCYGIFTGVVYSMLPYFATRIDFSTHQISWLMLWTVIGGTLPQFLIGYLSDTKDVRRVLFYLSLALVTSTIASILVLEHFIVFCMLSFASGACGFCLYNISVNMAMQNISQEQTVGTLSTILIVYGLGTVIGPLACGWWMHWQGSHGYFYTIIAMTAAMLVFSLGGFKATQQSSAVLIDDELKLDSSID